MGQYSKKGLYAGYDKNNKERQAEDYYATPPKEVYNILKTLQLSLDESTTILDPGCGGGHLIDGIVNYRRSPLIIGTDIKDRSNELTELHEYKNVAHYEWGEKWDFLSENYDQNLLDISSKIDYIIMNPPFNCIIPFVKHGLNLANKGVLMLGRLQFLESKSRYEEILKDNPPTKVYVYVDRIACYKDGNFNLKPNSIQSYAWFYWDKNNENKKTELEFIRRLD